MIIAFAGMQKKAKTLKVVSDETVFGRFGFWGVNSWAATSAARTGLRFLGGYERSFRAGSAMYGRDS